MKVWEVSLFGGDGHGVWIVSATNVHDAMELVEEKSRLLKDGELYIGSVIVIDDVTDSSDHAPRVLSHFEHMG